MFMFYIIILDCLWVKERSKNNRLYLCSIYYSLIGVYKFFFFNRAIIFAQNLVASFWLKMQFKLMTNQIQKGLEVTCSY